MQTTEDSREATWHAAAIARILAGDTDSYAQLVAHHRPRCVRYARRMLGDADEAEDAAQEAFVRAFRYLDKCEDPGHFGAWLFTILVNRCRTALEKRARWERLVVRQEEPDGSGHAGGDGSEAPRWANQTADELSSDPRFSLERVEAVLQCLSTEQREAFLLKHVEELSYEEISSLTGIGVSALKMRVSRARDFLRERLAEVCDGR